jgi:hypothetical protein
MTPRSVSEPNGRPTGGEVAGHPGGVASAVSSERRFVLDAKTFEVESNEGEGAQLPSGSRFVFRQADNRIWGTYRGGDVSDGELGGVIVGDRLRFVYRQIGPDGMLATGTATGAITREPNERLTVDIRWSWEDRYGRGRARLVELRPNE